MLAGAAEALALLLAGVVLPMRCLRLLLPDEEYIQSRAWAVAVRISHTLSLLRLGLREA